MPRADFSAATRTVIAQRAGYQCSVLNCGRLTVGPGQGPQGVLSIGMAAHIFAAAPRGPRGSGGLSREELCSPENGIWCCYDHGKLIDAAEGREFTAVELQAWKRLHEARKAAELSGMAADRFGLVDSVTIHSAPASLSGRMFEFGMRNFITGPNASGKTILAQLIGSVAYPHLIARMSRRTDVDMAVRWYDPHTRQVSMSGRSGNLRQVLDGRIVPYVARPFKTIMLSMERAGSINLRSLAQMFDLGTTAMKAVLEDLVTLDGTVREVKVRGEDVEFVTVVGGQSTRSSSLSSGSPALNTMFLLEVAAAHAGFHASVEPTILLLDEALYLLHPEAEAATLDRLDRTCGHAQLAVVTHSANALSARADWNRVTLGDWRAPAQQGVVPVDVTIESGGREGHTASDAPVAETLSNRPPQ
jgi:hypothetical protein